MAAVKPKTKSAATEKAKPSSGAALARPGDPYVTLDGTVIKPKTPPREVSIDRVVDPANFRPDKKRNLNELPAQPRIMNAVAVVLIYTLLGVGDREIADTLNTTVPELEALRRHPAYGETFETILNVFISSNSSMLRSRIAAYSHDALTTMADLSSNGKMERTKFEASRDLLDRAGVSPKEAALAQVSQMTGLRIIMVAADDGKVNIDVGINADDIDD